MTEVVKNYLDFFTDLPFNASNFVDLARGGNAEYVKSIQSFECMKEMCVMTKKSKF
jgi:hypothetical protein